MNYFELFGIPVQLTVDRQELQPRFIALSREFHPDYHAQSDAGKQAEMLEQSAMLNKAWKTFQRPEDTIKYVLQLKGLLEEEEKYNLPPDFLMEVMDINEELMEATDPAAMASLEKKIDQLQNELYEPVEKIVTDYQENTGTEKELLQVKDYYFKKKYLDRIRQQLAGKA